jgi:glycerol-3-phosphate dehydrogenase
MNTAATERERTLTALPGMPLDLVIIGGGIVGAGVARDAASRGLRTLLVERADFASGTSGRSSRLLHGGLRYLAQWRIGLVWQASAEKMRLHRIAPHLCQPLPFLFPAWRGVGWPRWKLSLGVFVYDLLCGGRNLGPSRTLTTTGTLKAVPGLRPEGLTGATRHFDALTCDARLVLDTLRSARQAGANLLNYASFVSAARAGDGWAITVRDETTGATVEARARCVVNAAGPWAARFPQSGVHLRLTKGAHLVVDQQRLPVAEAVILPEGNRLLFVIPWGERVILGTTDTDYEGDPAGVHTNREDVRYILGVVNDAFPGAGLSPADVISTWAGVRPLIAPARDARGTPSDISRGHVIRMSEPGWLDVAGGKLTTYRLMAEQAVDHVARFLKVRLPRSRTAEVPLSRGPYSGVLPPAIEEGVVAEFCQAEWIVHLEDVLLRRTSWHFYHPHTAAIAEQVAGWMAAHLGWDVQRREAELARYRDAVDPPSILAPGG